MHLGKKIVKGISFNHPLGMMDSIPKKIEESRLDFLVQKIRDGTATQQEKDEIIIGHVRLAIQIASRYAVYKYYLANDLVSIALQTVTAIVNKAGEKLKDNNITPFIVTHIHGALARLIAKEMKETNHQVLTSSLVSPHTCNIHDLKDEIYKCSKDSIDKFIIDMKEKGYVNEEIAEFLQVSRATIFRKMIAITERYEKLTKDDL